MPMANRSVNRTACKLCLQVPYALRAPDELDVGPTRLVHGHMADNEVKPNGAFHGD